MARRKPKPSSPRPDAVEFIPDRTKNRFYTQIDKLHFQVRTLDQQLVQDIWASKYKWADEQVPSDAFERVARDIYKLDTTENLQEAYEAMNVGLWMPGGRIIAGAGTSKRVTLNNCYVNQTVQDDLENIMQALSAAAVTQQQGGGIGTDFSTLRPEGAILRRTGARASGPLPFMDMWHSMCATIMSAGDRRGAMMGTLSDTHPDLPKFIVAKQTQGRLTNFNVSVLVSDAFMEAVREDEDWLLYFDVPPAVRDPITLDYDFEDDAGKTQYAYSVWKARELWELIVKNTYEWSEPGIIFIDRINSLNNLKYCETIRCTNPCGEQPLPPDGTCNLGAINLSRMVLNPFTPQATFNWDLLATITKLGIRFLDNVIDRAAYPLETQRKEQASKRRTGLGVSGLADALAQLQQRYGSAQSVATTERIFQTICEAAYEGSCELAAERGPFPLFQASEYLQDGTFASSLREDIRVAIKRGGIRNGVLLTVAPTGTTSILYGNISSGIEPVFEHQAKRKVRQADNSFREYGSYSYNFLLYGAYIQKQPGDYDTPSYMVTTNDLTIEDHIAIQAAVQRWVDASVSKTINVAASTTFDEFRKCYDLAYTLGCKGCTTYRPSNIRGSILSRATDTSQSTTLPVLPILAQRPEVLRGITHKVKWPSMSSALYITVNYLEDHPFEVFFASKDARSQEWMMALSLMISAILRKGGDVRFIGDELLAVRSVHDTAWIKVVDEEKPRFFGSLIAYVGHILSKDLTFQDVGLDPHTPTLSEPPSLPVIIKERCEMCGAPAIEHKEGCKTCLSCGHSNCN